MLWSAKESLIVSPGASLTGVLGPGGFGKGGSEVWQPPHASAAKTRKAKRQDDGLNSRLRSALSVHGNCRSSHICLLFCVMQSCLLYKIVDGQDKCDEVGDRSPEGRKVRCSVGVTDLLFNRSLLTRWKSPFSRELCVARLRSQGLFKR